MSAAEIFILALMGIIALQMFFFYRVIQSSLETMQACSETSDQAFSLAVRAIDVAAMEDAESAAMSPAHRLGEAP